MRQNLGQCMASGSQCIRAGLGDARAARAALAPLVTAQDGSLAAELAAAPMGVACGAASPGLPCGFVHQAAGLGCRG